MPDLQMDVAVANRFISSLSKSLQALCHGCMEFDSGIEIVGYINVNIDCGSKVDYVLNEKVLKSTTNSMTFVSNSFLAKKEQQKQTRDGMCSPISEINQQAAVMSPFQNRARGHFHGLHPKNVTPASHSYMHHGSQKRSWTGMERDWRMSPKKQRDGRHSYPSHREPGSIPQGAHSNPLSSPSSQNPADSNFRWPQTSTQGSDTSNVDNHQEINIKKELLESDTGKETDQSEHDQSHTLDQDTNENLDQISKVTNIKSDPDASSAVVSDETAADRSINELNSDYKGTFLEPSTSDKSEDASEQNKNKKHSDDNSEDVAVGSLEQTDDSAVTEGIPTENITPGSEMPVEYDEAGEEGAYAQSVYSDAGEGSSDAGQFEVIEIEDEDEDVQAMFGEPHGEDRGRHMGPYASSSKLSNKPLPSHVRISATADISEEDRTCPFCAEVSATAYLLKRHMSSSHNQQLPFKCQLCGKGFLSSSGLRHHKRGSHMGRCFVCDFCGAKFKHKHHMNDHVRKFHAQHL